MNVTGVQACALPIPRTPPFTRSRSNRNCALPPKLSAGSVRMNTLRCSVMWPQLQNLERKLRFGPTKAIPSWRIGNTDWAARWHSHQTRIALGEDLVELGKVPAVLVADRAM